MARVSLTQTDIDFLLDHCAEAQGKLNTVLYGYQYAEDGLAHLVTKLQNAQESSDE